MLDAKMELFQDATIPREGTKDRQFEEIFLENTYQA